MRGQRSRPAVAVAPDGGYSWVILLACFLVFALTFGVIKSFGVLFVEIHRYFETTATGTSWITSIAVAAIHCVAPVGSALSARYSHRSVVMTGGLLSGIGMVGGAYARTLVELYITVGFLTGCGYALAWTPSVTLVGLYFERRRPLANALASTGECIFTFLLSPFLQLLVDHYSWRGALLVLGGLQLNLCVCGMLLRPLEPPQRRRPSREEEEGLALEVPPPTERDPQGAVGAHAPDEALSSRGAVGAQAQDEALSSRRAVGVHAPDEALSSRRAVGVHAPDEALSSRRAVGARAPDEALSSRRAVGARAPDEALSGRGAALRGNVLRYVDYTLISSPSFVVYSTFGFFAALGFFAPALFLVPYARSRGVEEYQAAALMSISAASDLSGRVLFGWVANLRLTPTVQQLTASVLVLGGVLLLCPLAGSFPELAAFSAAFGLAYGATVSVHITVLADVVGVHRLGSALGFFMLLRSSGGLLGPPIAGFFIDKMSDYGTGFLMAGVALIVSALFLMLLHQMTRRGLAQSPVKGRGSSTESDRGLEGGA